VKSEDAGSFNGRALQTGRVWSTRMKTRRQL